MNVKKLLSLSLGLFILGIAAVLLGTGTVGASPRLHSLAAAPPTPSIPVAVTNTPLPVSINGTPTVNANVGTPSVNILGTPNVNANVTTTPTTPLYVDTDTPARNGFDVSCGTDPVDPTYGQASCTLFQIPAGREVVIESLACDAFLVTGNMPGQADLVVGNESVGPFPSGAEVLYPIALNKTGSQNGLDLYQIMTPFRVYASSPAGGAISVGLFYRTNPSSTYGQAFYCAVTGHIVR
jgi:hypothetical protein